MDILPLKTMAQPLESVKNTAGSVANFGKEKYAATQKKLRSFRIGERVRKHPFLSFFSALTFLFLVIAASSFATKTPEETLAEPAPKSVSVYKVGGGSEITTQARIQKTGVIKIYALSPGIVQSVNFKEGDQVSRGQTLVNLSTNYTGGSAQGVQTQIASAQYKNAVETYDTQKDLINKQREIANLTNANTEELRDISEQSVDETRDLINFNRQIMDSLNANLAQLEATNVNGANDAAILQVQTAKSQLQGGLNGLDANIRNLEYQSNPQNNPTQLTNLQKDITLKQLDVQEKSLELGKKVAGLQLSLAQIQASLMAPASPVNGSVQKVHVVFGQNVSPGTLLVTIFQPEHENTATAFVPQGIAPMVSQSEPSILTLANGKAIKVTPRFVSAEATDGQLYSVLYNLPTEHERMLTDGEFVSISIPVSEIDDTETNMLVPLDAVYQGPDGASVFIVQDGKALEKNIKVGQIVGAYIEVLEGISEDDQIILDRTVIGGDKVTVKGQ